MRSGRAWLDVGSAESKELLRVTDGAARYDEQGGSWYVELADAMRYGQFLQRWFRPVLSTRPDEPVRPMTVLGLAYECWRCKRPSLAVVHCRLPDHEISATARAPLELAARALWSADAGGTDRRREWAHFKARFSKTQAETYFSNGCRFDEALFGEVPLRQRYEALRGDPDAVVTLATVPVPARLVQEVLDS